MISESQDEWFRRFLSFLLLSLVLLDGFLGLCSYGFEQVYDYDNHDMHFLLPKSLPLVLVTLCVNRGSFYSNMRCSLSRFIHPRISTNPATSTH